MRARSAPISPTQPGTQSRPYLILPFPNLDLSLAVPLPYLDPSSLYGPTSPSFTPTLSDLERLHRIGSGSAGTVWLVRHRFTGQSYALKVIYACYDDAVCRQIRREIEILRTANNNSVVRCHGMYDCAGEIQILFEYMDGGSLRGRQITSEPVLADVARQILTGLAYLHSRKIVHGDIKPSNLLINGDLQQVKIADFGVRRILEQSTDPYNSSIKETIAYMSPERINTDLNHGGVYDGYAGDIWSFGLSALEFYLGWYPFGDQFGNWQQGDLGNLMRIICYSDPPVAPPEASSEFRSFVTCCLQKEPSRRLTAAQLLHHPFIAQPKLSSP